MRLLLSVQSEHRYFALYACVHFLVWVLIPLTCRHNVPLDTLEGIVWGLEWQWVYDKHPPFAHWLTALATLIIPNITYSVYITAQLVHVVGLWAIWRLARSFFSAPQALITVFLLQGIWYYNILTPKLNPNTLMTSMWALSIWSFYRATSKYRYQEWLITGGLLGLCLLTKYQSVILMACVHGYYWLMRRHLPPGKYFLAMHGVCFLMLLPNIIQLYQCDFAPFVYALTQMKVVPNGQVDWVGHVIKPLDFFIEQLGAMALCPILLFPLWRQSKGSMALSKQKKYFVYVFALGPLVLTCLLIAITSMTTYARWGSPYLILSGFLAMIWLRPQVSMDFLRRYFVFVLTITLLVGLGRAAYLQWAPRLFQHTSPDAYLPGQEMANFVTDYWHQHQKGPLPYVIGNHYLVVNICAYSQDKPRAFFEGDRKKSPWIDAKDVRKKGAMVVWWHSPFIFQKTIEETYQHFKYVGSFTFPKHTPHVKEYVSIHMGMIEPIKEDVT